MRAVVQRVSAASVEVEGQLVGSIDTGLLVYLAAGKVDEEDDARWMADKVATLRIFQDDAGKMSLSVSDVGGAVLVISQFTLYGDVRKGRRPSFDAAAPPDRAQALYEQTCEHLRGAGLQVETGRFRAKMNVKANVAGPVTILVDSKKGF
jgi:D-tyrosyl-tRNA(Tyr) deacylase